MSRRNQGRYRERNGIGSSVPIAAHVAKLALAHTCTRLETELADTRAVLNLALERAEDAEAELAEALPDGKPRRHRHRRQAGRGHGGE